MSDWDDERCIPLDDATRVALFRWSISGRAGVSSKTIVWACTGLNLFGRNKFTSTPQDAGDFGRCAELIAQFEWLRPLLPVVARKYPEWRPIVKRWRKLELAYSLDELTPEMLRGTSPK